MDRNILYRKQKKGKQVLLAMICLICHIDFYEESYILHNTHSLVTTMCRGTCWSKIMQNQMNMTADGKKSLFIYLYKPLWTTSQRKYPKKRCSWTSWKCALVNPDDGMIIYRARYPDPGVRWGPACSQIRMYRARPAGFLWTGIELQSSRWATILSATEIIVQPTMWLHVKVSTDKWKKNKRHRNVSPQMYLQ